MAPELAGASSLVASEIKIYHERMEHSYVITQIGCIQKEGCIVINIIVQIRAISIADSGLVISDVNE